MSVKDELIVDFNVHIPKVMISGNLCIIDNVKKIVLITEKGIVVGGDKGYVALEGSNMIIKEIDDERVQISGEIRTVEFYETLSRG